MAKRRRTSSMGKAFSVAGAKNYALKGASIVGGIAIGTVLQKFISKKDSVSGTDLLGLDGKVSQYTTPAILLGAGMVAHAFVKNETLKNVALGIGAAGGVNLVNTIAGSTKISLAGEETPALMPGVGEVVNYDQLPTDNEALVENPDGFTINGDDVDFAGVEDYTIVNGVDDIL